MEDLQIRHVAVTHIPVSIDHGVTNSRHCFQHISQPDDPFFMIFHLFFLPLSSFQPSADHTGIRSKCAPVSILPKGSPFFNCHQKFSHAPAAAIPEKGDLSPRSPPGCTLPPAVTLQRSSRKKQACSRWNTGRRSTPKKERPAPDERRHDITKNLF